MERILDASENDHLVWIPAGSVTLEGELALPTGARGVVVFAHGAGSGRYSPRNRYVARRFRRAGLGTLLVDLLSEEEIADDAMSAEYRYDTRRQAARLVAITNWLRSGSDTAQLHIGYFGSSTGAAAALLAAAARPNAARAIVARGGRPELARSALSHVFAPTLLIVGGEDAVVLAANREALIDLPVAELVIVPGATHMFEEAGALDEVARLGADWFVHHLVGEEAFAPL